MVWMESTITRSGESCSMVCTTWAMSVMEEMLVVVAVHPQPHSPQLDLAGALLAGYI